MMRVSRTTATSAVAAGLLLLAGCGTSSVSGDDVAEQVSTQLERQVGQKPDKVDCPELAAEKGEQVTCTITAGEQTIDATVKVTSVEGKKVNFSIEVADKPNE